MKRLNPNTGLPFKHGEIREDGYIFKGYRSKRNLRKDGFFQEDWYTPEKFEKSCLKNKKAVDANQQTKIGHLKIYLRNAKNRAIKKELPFDIDLEYLKTIATDECPVFKTKFIWGLKGRGHEPTCASLDRIIPELGYVKGNVVFISSQANSIKSNATEVELYAVADWLHDERKKVLNVKKRKLARISKTNDRKGKKNT